ncbi:unnamed protein product [Acanthosepion pharaonis]|uniref:Uncharacterized protein n=1 Tax=Acanthosepion pharaonis TaxID=158019 RepID=A0A812C5H3_ACAPH|nr:unnamed protein product [Sepia pharaonis]
MSQLYSFKAVEDSFQQPKYTSRDCVTFMSQSLFLQGCRRFLSATKWCFERLHVPALFLQGCRKIPFNEIVILHSVPALFLQGCRSFQERLHVLFLQGNLSNQCFRDDFMSQLYSFKAVEDSFQQMVMPNFMSIYCFMLSETTTSCPSFIPSGCRNSRQIIML